MIGQYDVVTLINGAFGRYLRASVVEIEGSRLDVVIADHIGLVRLHDRTGPFGISKAGVMYFFIDTLATSPNS